MLPTHTYRPWLTKSRESHLTDHDVLRSLVEGPQTPFGIAGESNRISTVRVQCLYMDWLGYVNQTSIDTYNIAARGEAALQDDIFEEGYINLEQEMKLDYAHVTNLGELLNANTLIKINKQFYKNEDVPYETQGITIHDIESVREARLERLTTEFPRFEPLTNQLAHAVRTFCGYHPFPDANHRTGTHIADQLAQKEGYDLFRLISQDTDGIVRAVMISKILRGICSNVREGVDQLWIKDELFYHWNRYFRDLLHDLVPQKRVHMITGRCQYDGLISNGKVKYILNFAEMDVEEMQEIMNNVGED